MTITVNIACVDTTRRCFERDDEWLRELQRLRANGWVGKDLIDRLIAEDWDVPPTYMEVTAPGLHLMIRYD
jgi:hypothetical protein